MMERILMALQRASERVRNDPIRQLTLAFGICGEVLLILLLSEHGWFSGFETAILIAGYALGAEFGFGTVTEMKRHENSSSDSNNEESEENVDD